MIQGIIMVACGIYLTLMGYGIVPRKVKDPERMELWRKKFGRTVRIGGLATCLFGLVEIAGLW